MIHAWRYFFKDGRFPDARPIGNGNINDTYRVDFEQAGAPRTALIQRLNHLVFKQPEVVMENMVRVCRYLENQDYPYQSAAPIPAPDGSCLYQDEAGNFWRAFPFVENSFAPEGISDSHIAYEASRAYGAFARALRDFPVSVLVETIPGFHDTDQRWLYFLKTLAENPKGRAEETQPEIEAMFATKRVFDQISLLKQSGQLPLRVTHNDTKAGNILFHQKTLKALAVIDLDTVMPGTVLSDFGDMVRSFAPNAPEDSKDMPQLRLEVLDALKQGYLEATGEFLGKIERENLMLGAAWMAGEQALRFLTDWLAGDVYYKNSLPGLNLLRARNQLALFGSIEQIL